MFADAVFAEPPFAALAAATIAGLAMSWNRKVRGFLPDDLPRPGRKQHPRPVPLAGIALLPALLAWLLPAGRWILAAAVTAVAVLGFVDDWYKERERDLDWRLKALVLGLAAAAVAGSTHDPLTAPWSWLCAWILVFVLTNAANFIDNTDGVAVAVTGTALLVATSGHGALAACGFCALGFLPWNWPRPTLFLGDAGAYALGLCAGAACAEGLPDAMALLPFAVLLVDFVQVVLVRLYLGLRPWIGDRRHLTHVAMNVGLPRVLVAPLLAGLTLGLVLLTD